MPLATAMSRKGKQPGGRGENLVPAQKAQRTLLTQQSYSGPLPPPELLAQYETLFPGAADRIFQYAEREQANRHSLDAAELETRAELVKAEMEGESKFLLQGQRLVFLLLTVMVIIGGWLASLGLTMWALGLLLPILGGFAKLIMSHPNRTPEAPPPQPERPSLPPPGKATPALPG